MPIHAHPCPSMPIHAIQVQSTTTLNNPLRQPSFYICTLTHSNFSSDTSMILRQYQRLIVPLTRHRLAQLPRSNGNNKFLFCSKSTPRYGRETSKEAPLPEAADNIGMTTHIGRLVFAFGIVYVVTEFGLELTMCEGPSMLPTILHRGEIVLLDRATPRWFGLHHGTNGRERARLARALQKQRMGGKTIWYEPRIPVNQLPPEQAWDRFWQRVSTPVSVGDVVVVQHPDRVGTVCKRVLGLPGDIVTKPTTRRGAANVSPHQQRGHLVVPDGHIWVEGDNPWNSSDSRNYGSVPASLIVGRVLFRVWPLRGNSMMERGARPQNDEEEPHLTFSGSVVFPAGFDNQIIVRDYKTFLRSCESPNQE